MSSTKLIKRITVIVLIILSLIAVRVYKMYKMAFAPNIDLGKDRTTVLYIDREMDYQKVKAQLITKGHLKDTSSFNWTAIKKNYPEKVRPGRYLLRDRMSNNDLVNMLRAGMQEPVRVTFNNMRTLEFLAGRLAAQLEPDSAAFITAFRNADIQQKYGLDQATFPCLFIPNTYEFYWTTTPESFIDRMATEYERFWTNNRVRKAEKAGLTRQEVITLASIVQQETHKTDEKPKVAGVYINRLHMGMKLDADPTVIFAVGDFTIRRVLKKHYQIDSPYNTYKNKGLPPGPICMPDISTIDAVLNYEKHKYLYFCLKPDFSGYHTFARTLKEQNRNAAN